MRRIFIAAAVALSMSSAVGWGATTVIRSASGTRMRPAGGTAKHRAGDGRARARARRQRSAVQARHASRVFLFGEQRVEPATRATRAGSIAAFRFVDHTAGVASAITVYLDSRSRARRLVAGVYSDARGRPAARLAAGAVGSPRAGAWNLIAIRPTRVAAGSAYWIAVRGVGAALAVREATSSRCGAGAASLRRLPSMPARGGHGIPLSGCLLSGFVSGRRATSGMGLAPITAGPLAPAPGVGSGSSSGSPPSGASAPSGSGAPVPAPAPVLPPVNDGAPVVSGSPVAGQTLTSTDGSWLDGPTAYSYQWEDCDGLGLACAAIAGASASTYTLAAADVGATIRAVVTASNAGGSSPATSAPTAIVASSPSAPSNTALPAVTGQTVQGGPLTTTNGSWNGSPTSYSYQWDHCDSSGANCSAISGATSSTYTLAAGDVGHTIRSVVTATNASGSIPATSVQTGVVTAVAAPSNTALPVVSGSTVQGSTLTTTTGSWNGSPTSYAYKWKDCDSSGANCTAISGATASTYTLVASDVGDTIRSVVTATNAGGSTPATSTGTAAITATSGGGGGAITGESLISQSASTYSSGTAVWPVSNMNDGAYDEYRCTPTCAGILHFASAPTGSAEVSWYNDDNDFWASVPFLGDPNYNLPKTFTIDGCAASCTGAPPSAGWVHLESISNNIFNGGQYVVNLGTGCGGSPCTWLRMDVTGSTGSSGNTDAAWHLDVAACASTCDDTWLFLGDSITNNSMPHVPTSPPNFMQTINASASGFYPSEIEGGVSFSKTCDWLGISDSGTSCPDGAPTSPNMVTSALNAFPAAHFVTLDLGTNDLNGSGTNYNDTATTQFQANLTALVQDVINAGRVPVVPTVPWAPTACDSSAALTNDNPATNGTPNYWITHTLYGEFPQVVHGPDLWTYFDQHQSLINTSNCPHPTTTGQNDYRTLWASTLLSEIYP